MVKFHKIRQFKDVIREIRSQTQFQGIEEDGTPIFDRGAVMPKIDFIGTVKLHGTNSSVRFNPENQSIEAQSRNNIIDVDNDNAGFARFAFETVGKEYWIDQLSSIYKTISESGDKIKDPQVTVYGEWCGGSIQKGVALNALDKMFVVFAIRIGTSDDSIWLGREFIQNFNNPSIKIFNIFQFPTYNVTIDFGSPSSIQNQLIEITNEVERCCPVGAHFGVNGIGEGVVWRPDSEKHPEFNKSSFAFKVKGEKHSDTKTKTIAEIDPEKTKNINDFVLMVCTGHRLEKGVDFLIENNMEISKRSIGEFLKWFGNDILEEESDTMEASNLERKDVMKAVNQYARNWFIEYADSIPF